jgi:hypothetical protein
MKFSKRAGLLCLCFIMFFVFPSSVFSEDRLEREAKKMEYIASFFIDTEPGISGYELKSIVATGMHSSAEEYIVRISNPGESIVIDIDPIDPSMNIALDMWEIQRPEGSAVYYPVSLHTEIFTSDLGEYRLKLVGEVDFTYTLELKVVDFSLDQNPLVVRNGTNKEERQRISEFLNENGRIAVILGDDVLLGMYGGSYSERNSDEGMNDAAIKHDYSGHCFNVDEDFVSLFSYGDCVVVMAKKLGGADSSSVVFINSAVFDSNALEIETVLRKSGDKYREFMAGEIGQFTVIALRLGLMLLIGALWVLGIWIAKRVLRCFWRRSRFLSAVRNIDQDITIGIHLKAILGVMVLSVVVFVVSKILNTVTIYYPESNPAKIAATIADTETRILVYRMMRSLLCTVVLIEVLIIGTKVFIYRKDQAIQILISMYSKTINSVIGRRVIELISFCLLAMLMYAENFHGLAGFGVVIFACVFLITVSMQVRFWEKLIILERIFGIVLIVTVSLIPPLALYQHVKFPLIDEDIVYDVVRSGRTHRSWIEPRFSVMNEQHSMRIVNDSLVASYLHFRFESMFSKEGVVTLNPFYGKTGMERFQSVESQVNSLSDWVISDCLSSQGYDVLMKDSRYSLLVKKESDFVVEHDDVSAEIGSVLKNLPDNVVLGIEEGITIENMNQLYDHPVINHSNDVSDMQEGAVFPMNIVLPGNFQMMTSVNEVLQIYINYYVQSRNFLSERSYFIIQDDQGAIVYHDSMGGINTNLNNPISDKQEFRLTFDGLPAGVYTLSVLSPYGNYLIATDVEVNSPIRFDYFNLNGSFRNDAINEDLVKNVSAHSFPLYIRDFTTIWEDPDILLCQANTVRIKNSNQFDIDLFGAR